uniref:Uncharacterized protein n=1 Tax=Knipowitschia caucasica TaxID=637954 RepID=A0AAV2LSA0_KNICA
MARAKEAVAVEGASALRSFDVRLMSHLNSLSQLVLGCALVPEFTPPGKPTDERTAVEYLLGQTNRGDLLAPAPAPENPSQVLEEEEEEEEEEEAYAPIHMPELLAGDARDQLLEGDTEPTEPVTPKTSQCDSRGVVGWESVDALAAYLVGLNRTTTALSAKEEADIVPRDRGGASLYLDISSSAWACVVLFLTAGPALYSQKGKKKGQVSAGPWRAPRKPSGSAPGQQAAERLYMIHGQAAQDPEANRVSECVCLRLAKEFDQARNRPKDVKGKTMPIPQSIVSVYSHLRQLLEDSRVVLGQTNVVLVPVNNTTVSSWLLRRDKRKDRDMLLQGTVLPKQLHQAKEPLPSVSTLPAAPEPHAQEMTFEEPENREGEAFPRQRNVAGPSQPVPHPPPPPFPSQYGPAPPLQQAPHLHHPPFPHVPPHLHPQYPYPPPFPHAPPFQYAPPLPQAPPLPHAPPCPEAPPLQQPPAGLPSQPRQRAWRLNKAAQEDEERALRGEPPKKRLAKEKYHYTCKQCGENKSKTTGHTQVKGRWYCPASGLTLEDWRRSLN